MGQSVKKNAEDGLKSVKNKADEAVTLVKDILGSKLRVTLLTLLLLSLLKLVPPFTWVTPPISLEALSTTRPFASNIKTLVSFVPPGTLLIVIGTLKSIAWRLVEGIVKAADSVLINETVNRLAEEPVPSNEPDNDIESKMAFEADI